MATLFSLNDGNLTDSNVFGQTISSCDVFNNTSTIDILTAYSSPLHTLSSISDGSSISAIAVNLSYRSNTPIGTLTMLLSSNLSSITETYAVSSFTPYDGRNNFLLNTSQNWQILKLSTPFNSTSGSMIVLDFKTSNENQLYFVGGPIIASEASKARAGTFNGTFNRTDIPFINKPEEISYSFSTSKANFDGYNDTVFGQGDFTIDLWFKLNSISTYIPLLMKGIGYNGGGYTNDWFIYFYTTDNTIRFNRYADVTVDNIFSYTPVVSTWTHIAACRKSGLLTIYINGSSVGSKHDATNYFNNTNHGIQLGASYMANAWQYTNGLITNARVIAGKALYTSNFTVTASPLLLDSGTTIANYKSTTSPVYVSEITPFLGDNAEDGSLYFNGTSDFLRVPEVVLGTNNFTAECWVYITASTAQQMIMGQWGATGGTTLSWFIGTSNNTNRNLRFIVSNNGSAVLFDQVTTTPLPLNTWSHVALTRDTGGVYRIFLNGVLCGNGTITNNSALFNATNDLTIGATSNAAQFFNGYISNVRIVNGTALYTANFDTSLPTAPFTNVLNTALLIRAPYSPFTYGATGTPTLSSISPFGIGTDSSVRFNGTNDYFTVPASTDFNFTSGTFTIEAWVRFDDLNNHVIASNYNSTTTGWTFQYIASRLKFNAAGNPDHIMSETTAIAANTWYHVAVAGSPGAYRMFINGVQVGNTYTGTTSLAGGTLYIGTFTSPTNYHKGAISNLRIVNGRSLYNQNFDTTAPISPLTPLTNVDGTVLLLKDNYNTRYTRTYSTPFLLDTNIPLNKSYITTTTKDPSILDFRYVPLTKSGTTTLSSASPYGVGVDSSIYFGSGVVQVADTTALGLSADDFTIEFWAYRSFNGDYSTLFELGVYNDGMLLRRDGFWVDGTHYPTWFNDTTFPLYQWRHIALSRYNDVVTIYINGLSSFSVSVPTINFNTSNALTIGDSRHTGGGGQYFRGSISNFRIVKGTAVYTTNFTPPSTEPLKIIPNTSLLYNHPYGNTYIASVPNNIHIGGSLKGLSSEVRVLTASTINIGDVYVHNQGNLVFPSNSSTSLNLDGPIGLQITSDGTLNIGTSTNPVPKNITHRIQFRTNNLCVNNGGTLNVYGAYKLPYTYQSFDTLTGVNTFSTTDNVSSTWAVNDVLLFTPTPFSRVSDILVLSGFTGSNIFRTTSASVYRHNSLSSVPVPTVLNTTRNVKIEGATINTRGNVLVIDAAKANINNAELDNLGYDLVGYRNIIFNTNSNGYVNLINCTMNSGRIANIGAIGVVGSSLRPYAHNVTLDNNIIYNFGSTIRGLVVADALTNNLKVTNNYISGGGGGAGSLYFVNMTAYDMQVNNNYIVNSNTNGTFITRSTISGAFGSVTNYNSLSQGLALSLSGNSLSGINLSGINCLYSTREGIYIDAANVGNTIGDLTFNNINILSSGATGFVLANNTQNYLRPFNLNLNNLSVVGNTNGFTLSNICGNLSNLYIATTSNNLDNSITVGNRKTLISNISTYNNLQPINTNLTNTGTPVVTSVSPFGTGTDGSIYFDGNSEVRTTVGTTDFSLTGKYTLEFWFRPMNFPTDVGLISHQNGGGGSLLGWVINLYSNVSVDLIYYINAQTQFSLGMSPPAGQRFIAGQWYHVAITSDGTTIRTFLDGRFASSASYYAMGSNAHILTLGAWDYSLARRRFTGYLSNIRLINNTCLYRNTFIPSNVPLRCAFNTVFLYNGLSYQNRTFSRSTYGLLIKGRNYNETIINNISHNSSIGSLLALENPKFEDFTLQNSITNSISSTVDILSDAVLEGSYNFHNNIFDITPLTATVINNYQSDIYTETGFSFMNHNNIPENHFRLLKSGKISYDRTVVNAPNTVSERLEPYSSDIKLRSVKLIPINKGENYSISVTIKKSPNYTGAAPRLMLKHNGSLGYNRDYVLATSVLGNNVWETMAGSLPSASLDNGMIEVYVDCSGNLGSGYINIDSWKLI